jgi:23S rRNA-/tRNA-specific pseudouridylate synthase
MAIVEGNVEKEEIWQDKLVRDTEKKKSFISKENSNDKIAITKVTPLAAKDNYSLIRAEIATGRTHQIRVQAASRGHPLLGDVKYGKAKNNEQRIMNKGLKANFYLHAWKLEFLEHSIEAPLPQEFRDKIKILFGSISEEFTRSHRDFNN